MVMFPMLVMAVISCLVLVALMHSILGERLLLIPMFRARGNRVLDNDLARMVLRGAWHLTSLLWLMFAVIVFRIGFGDGDLAREVLLVMGIGFGAAGVLDAVWSKGRHVGWPVLLAVGVFSLWAWRGQAVGLT